MHTSPRESWNLDPPPIWAFDNRCMHVLPFIIQIGYFMERDVLTVSTSRVREYLLNYLSELPCSDFITIVLVCTACITIRGSHF